jgi:hypothetical protein
MAKRFTARELAEFADRVRYQRHLNHAEIEDAVQFRYQKGDRLAILSSVRFGRNDSGKPTKKTIDCLDDGLERSYDRKYDFNVAAFLIEGQEVRKF